MAPLLLPEHKVLRHAAGSTDVFSVPESHLVGLKNALGASFLVASAHFVFRFRHTEVTQGVTRVLKPAPYAQEIQTCTLHVHGR